MKQKCLCHYNSNTLCDVHLSMVLFVDHTMALKLTVELVVMVLKVELVVMVVRVKLAVMVSKQVTHQM